MSKLSHAKSVARYRRGKHDTVKRFSHSEMKQRFKGNKDILNLKRKMECTIKVDDQIYDIWIRIDKNGQICDCYRVGNVFDTLHGRCPETVDWMFWFANELENNK